MKAGPSANNGRPPTVFDRVVRVTIGCFLVVAGGAPLVQSLFSPGPPLGPDLSGGGVIVALAIFALGVLLLVAPRWR
jgi:hypothetical protein